MRIGSFLLFTSDSLPSDLSSSISLPASQFHAHLWSSFLILPTKERRPLSLPCHAKRPSKVSVKVLKAPVGIAFLSLVTKGASLSRRFTKTRKVTYEKEEWGGSEKACTHPLLTLRVIKQQILRKIRSRAYALLSACKALRACLPSYWGARQRIHLIHHFIHNHSIDPAFCRTAKKIRSLPENDYLVSMYNWYSRCRRRHYDITVIKWEIDPLYLVGSTNVSDSYSFLESETRIIIDKISSFGSLLFY